MNDICKENCAYIAALADDMAAAKGPPGSYKNNFEGVVEWINSQGGSYSGIPDKADQARLDAIARDCMRAYTPRPGDRELIGWFLFGDISGGAKGAEKAREADGICYIGKDGRAAVGISSAVLGMNPTYARVAVGLHELAHLTVDDHNDEFVSVLMQLQHNYYHAEGAHHRADSAELPWALVGRRAASL